MIKDIRRQIRETIRRHHLITAGDLVLAGVSGGADSIAMAHLLAGLRQDLGCRLHIIHVNHRLRKSADIDERFVKKLCQSLRLPCTAVTLDLKKFLSKGGSLEEVAREARYRAFFKTAKKIGAAAIALAHHEDDLAETVLMRILRGSGLLGLQAILPKREIGGHTVIRPMFEVTRRDVEDFLTKHRLRFRNDPTNRKTRFFRNKIRLHLLPLLEKEYQPNIRKILANLADVSSCDYDFLIARAQKIFKTSATVSGQKSVRVPLPLLRRLHPSLGRIVLRLSLQELQGNTRTFTLTHLREIDDLIKNRPAGAVVHLPQRIAVSKGPATIDFLKDSRLG